MHNPLPSRLIVDLPNWVGDQVMALPTVHRLVKANELGETTLHARPEAGRFLAGVFPEVRVVLSPRKASPIHSARRLCRDGGRFELGVTLRNASRAKICLWLAARKAVGSHGNGAGLLLTNCYSVDRRRHQVHDADPILEDLGLQGVDPSWKPKLPLEIVEEGARCLRRAGVSHEGAVGVAPTTALGEARRWPAAHYGELARSILDRGLEVVVVIGPGEGAFATAVQEAAGRPLPVVGGDVDVAGLAGVLARLSVLVGNDSGPIHLAAAVGTPGVAIFGPTDPCRTGPLSDTHVVLRSGLECAPCGELRCRLGHTACLHQIDVATVRRKVLESVA
jgi:heptosyltransferase-2